MEIHRFMGIIRVIRVSFNEFKNVSEGAFGAFSEKFETLKGFMIVSEDFKE